MDVEITVKPFIVIEGRFYIILNNKSLMSHASNRIVINQIDVEVVARYFWQ